MRVVTVASCKGGAGKTTASIMLANAFAKNGLKVALINVDPQPRTDEWTKRGALRGYKTISGLRLRHAPSSEDLRAELSMANADGYDLAIIDTDGHASREMVTAMGYADLVIIPQRNSEMDTQDTLETLSRLRAEAERQQRIIKARILFANTQIVAGSRSGRALNEALRGRVAAFKIELHNRNVIETAINEGCSLYDLKSQGLAGLAQAILNVEFLAEEVLRTLKQEDVVVPPVGDRTNVIDFTQSKVG